MGLRVVKDRDRGWKRIQKELKQPKGMHVAVGVMGAEAEELHGAGTLSVVSIAAIHEFGMGVPERSWLRGTVDEKRREILQLRKKLAASVLEGKRSRQQALELLGVFVQGEIQKRISAGIGEPLSPATIARKGSSKQLIDTGQFRGSVTYEVRKK